MPNIFNLPPEVMLMIFIHACFLDGDFSRLSMTCRLFHDLSTLHEQQLSKDIAKQQFFVPHRVLGFGGRIPNFANLHLLERWNREVLGFSRWCITTRQAICQHEYGARRAVWFTPLWQQHLIAGLLLCKKLSFSRYDIMEQLEQLPRPFHKLLRFTSIVASDMIRAGVAMVQGESAVKSMRDIWQAGEGPGEKEPSLETDDRWRALEMCLFELGCGPFMRVMHDNTSPNDWAEPLDPMRRSLPQQVVRDLMQQLWSYTVPQHRQYPCLLDSLCSTHGAAWGDASFWGNFDPFGLKDSGLSGDEVLAEMVKRL